jgi:hypothetical protein
MIETKGAILIQYFFFALLLALTALFFFSEWRLPIGEVNFSGLLTLGSDSPFIPFTKSQLIVGALSAIFIAYLSLLISRSAIIWTVFCGLAVISTFVALGHSYLPGGSGVAPILSTGSGQALGICVEKEVKVMSAPTLGAQAIEILPLQSPVMLTGKENGWYRATVSGGRTGWIPAEKVVIP